MSLSDTLQRAAKIDTTKNQKPRTCAAPGAEDVNLACVTCGTTVQPRYLDHGRCPRCAADMTAQEWADIRIETEAQEIAAEEAGATGLARIILTTEAGHDLKIVERLDIITAECVFGMHLFKDIFAGVRNIAGGHSKAMQATMRDARMTVLAELRKEALLIGADAVVGVDLDYSEISTGGSMLMVVASGTAVRPEGFS